MKRNVLAMITAALLVSGSVAPAAASSEQREPVWGSNKGAGASAVFADVPSDSWYYEAVQAVQANRLFFGTSSTVFSPNAVMTRGMFAQVLANFTPDAQNLKEDEAFRKFIDISSKDWYYSAAQWAGNHGILAGTEPGVFSPAQPITREEMVTMLYHYALRTGEPTPYKADVLERFEDAQEISPWAQDAFRWAVASGIIYGTTDTRLSPAAQSTRAQVAAMFRGALEKMTHRKMISEAYEETKDPNPVVEAFLTLSFDELKARYPVQALGEPDFKDPNIGFDRYYSTDALKGMTMATRTEALDNGTETEELGRIRVPLQSVLPQLAGKTQGEVNQLVGGISEMSGWGDILKFTTAYGTYEIALNSEDRTVNGEGMVTVYPFNGWRFVTVPENRQMTLRVDGIDFCTLTLPETYANGLIKEQHSKGHYLVNFGDKTHAKRYGDRANGWDNSFFRHIQIMDVTDSAERYAANGKSFVPSGGKFAFDEERDSLCQYFRLADRVYCISGNENFWNPVNGNDQEVRDNYMVFVREFKEVFQDVQLNPELVLVE